METQSHHLDHVRAALPAVRQYAYLNAGSSGPLPEPAIKAMAHEALDEAANGRIRFETFFAKKRPAMAGLRAAFARLLDADASEIALTHNTTDGVNMAVWGQPWREGEEIVVTDLEHEGGVMPAYLAAKRFGLKVRTLRLLDAPPSDAANIVDDGLSHRSRLLIVSHVSWANGARLPLKEIAEAAHARGCRVLVDAAQSAGAIPVSMRELGVDYYAVPGQKWLCGPEGMGALFVKTEAMDALSPTFTGYFALSDQENAWDCFGRMVLASDARRYENSSIYFPGVFGMLAALEWLESEVGWDWAFGRIAHLHAYARKCLAENPRILIFTPDEAAGLLHFRLTNDDDPEAVNQALVTRGVRIRTIPHMRCLRVSTGFWNTEAEIDALAAALKEILG
ncbi:MAG: aminotransferase class V-fold PLP-dependent enzyme [Chloroflexi bacterium]|nr:aminotransferase class V-fold PLP-dependent enzyme [Chloroflexota bacterium]